MHEGHFPHSRAGRVTLDDVARITADQTAELVEFGVSITEHDRGAGTATGSIGLVFAGPESDFSYGQIISFDGGWSAGSTM
jgi:hypothetical protein